MSANEALKDGWTAARAASRLQTGTREAEPARHGVCENSVTDGEGLDAGVQAAGEPG